MWIKNIIWNNKFFFSNFQFFKLLLHNQKILIKNFYIIKKKFIKLMKTIIFLIIIKNFIQIERHEYSKWIAVIIFTWNFLSKVLLKKLLFIYFNKFNIYFNNSG